MIYSPWRIIYIVPCSPRPQKQDCWKESVGRWRNTTSKSVRLIWRALTCYGEVAFFKDYFSEVARIQNSKFIEGRKTLEGSFKNQAAGFPTLSSVAKMFEEEWVNRWLLYSCLIWTIASMNQISHYEYYMFQSHTVIPSFPTRPRHTHKPMHTEYVSFSHTHKARIPVAPPDQSRKPPPSSSPSLPPPQTKGFGARRNLNYGKSIRGARLIVQSLEMKTN